MRTLSIDIGGTGIKAMVVAPSAKPLGDRHRVPTPRPATPLAIIGALATMLPDVRAFDRVSIGFPGVVVEGVVRTAPNLDPRWAGFDLAKAMTRTTGKPTRVLNDAGVQGHGVIRGRGVEACITLGTGLGFSLFVNGTYVPNVELAHHPFRKGRTYEQQLGKRALEHVGRRRWNRRLGLAIDQIQQTFNFDRLYVGGGNARKVTIKLPAHVTLVNNVSGLLGGVKLWERAGMPAAG